jgi:sporulation protein YlmC with PRC-barrel domain
VSQATLHEASRLPGLTVYTRSGKRLGVVHDILFDTSQRIVAALLITGTTPNLVKGGANIIIPYRWVQNLDDVVILRYFPDKLEFTEKEEIDEFSFDDEDEFYEDN